FVRVDKFFHRQAKLDLVDTRTHNIAGGRYEFGAGASLDTYFRIFLASLVDDRHGSCNRFYIVNNRGATIEACHGRERGFYTRVSTFTFEGFEQRCFLAAYVGAATGLHVNFQVIPRSQYIFAEEPCGLSL